MKKDHGHSREKNLLIRLREKPHHVKQIVSFAITLVIFSSILFVWLSSGDARSRELEVQTKTVSPLDGVTSMFSGFVSGLKQKVFEAPSNGVVATTSDDGFDISGVVVIDPSSGTTTSTSTSK